MRRVIFSLFILIPACAAGGGRVTVARTTSGDQYLAACLAIKVKSETAAKNLAACLNAKGVKLYGASSWCKPCKCQEHLLGQGFSFLNHVTCDLPDDPGHQVPECQEAKIRSYPTWVFPSGRFEGQIMTLPDLAHMFGCPWDPVEH